MPFRIGAHGRSIHWDATDSDKICLMSFGRDILDRRKKTRERMQKKKSWVRRLDTIECAAYVRCTATSGFARFGNLFVIFLFSSFFFFFIWLVWNVVFHTAHNAPVSGPLAAIHVGKETNKKRQMEKKQQIRPGERKKNEIAWDFCIFKLAWRKCLGSFPLEWCTVCIKYVGRVWLGPAIGLGRN